MPVDKKDFEIVMDSVLDDVASAIFDASQRNIMKNGSSDTGDMLGKANVNRHFLEKEIVYSTPQAMWIEYGTDPHPVSKIGRENIQRWAQRRLGLTERESVSASWGIVKKINREGSQATPFMRPAIEEVLVRGF